MLRLTYGKVHRVRVYHLHQGIFPSMISKSIEIPSEITATERPALELRVPCTLTEKEIINLQGHGLAYRLFIEDARLKSLESSRHQRCLVCVVGLHVSWIS
jgi:hypothetical protein